MSQIRDVSSLSDPRATNYVARLLQLIIFVQNGETCSSASSAMPL